MQSSPPPEASVPRAHLRFMPPQLVARDQQTLELRQFYPLPRPGDDESVYTLDAYFFFPRSFGITEQTWNREVFYRNTNILSRLHAPGLSLRVLKDLHNAANPAHTLVARLRSLMGNQIVHSTTLSGLAQILGAELSDAIRAEAKALMGLAQRDDAAQWSEDLWHGTLSLATDCLEALAAVRSVHAEAQAFRGVVPTLLPSLDFVEEYASAVIDETLSQLALIVSRSRPLHDGSCTAVALQLQLAAALEELNHRRRAHGHVRPRRDDGEYYSYRLGLLKKELQRSLYVNTRALDTDHFYANSAAMVAAGLAATWATLAQIPALTGAMRDSQGGLMLASTLGVAAYVLKDRIKDWVKARLTRRWANWDHDISVQGDSLAAVGLGAFTGGARERFRWSDEAGIPAEVTALRRRVRTVRHLSSELEQIFHYRRVLNLSPVARSPLPDGYGIEEMLRLNLDDVLRRFDDPHQMVAHYRGAGRFRAASMPKVYHLNVVTVVTSRQEGSRYTSRHRIVLNKQRILRVQRIPS